MPSDKSELHDICVVGLGYIGLPTALVLASQGLEVHGVDNNATVVDQLSSGSATIREPGIPELLTQTLENESFTVSQAPRPSSVFIIAVPTPLGTSKEADLSYVFNAVDAIIPNLGGQELIVLESTCPPGTASQVAAYMESARSDITLEPDLSNSIYIAHCPERVIPGNTLQELRNNSRIIGGINNQSSLRARDLYSKFCVGDLIMTDSTTAELTKLAENSFRDLNIAFANELSDIAQSLGINVWEVIQLANRHPRVQILNPGPGVGGHCIAIDPWFIHQSAPEQSPMIKLARELNDARPQKLVNRIVESVSPIANPRICALGLSFKANVDDLRESPAIKVVEELAKALPKSEIYVVEPNISTLPASLSVHENIDLVAGPGDWSMFEAVIVLTDHDAFKEFDTPTQSHGRVFDTRGMWNR
ncbi:nucleotide sugar dehydrogenase [Corynebacterium casei]|uniref:nucleotide sugar dehydrogenase n=1 Tax=Corynebacterium casei TaxID=160386 RepID=UPI003FD3F1A3